MQEWYLSVIDVVAVLTNQPDARHASTYWAVMKKRLNDEGANELLTNCKRLKMTTTDDKHRLTGVADTEQLLYIIQSILSPKAEPFKMWLAQIGRERIEETIDPELTNEWDARGDQQGIEYAFGNHDNAVFKAAVAGYFPRKSSTDREGGAGAGSARHDIEVHSGVVSVIASQDATQLNQAMTNMIGGVTANGTDNFDTTK